MKFILAVLFLLVMHQTQSQNYNSIREKLENQYSTNLKQRSLVMPYLRSYGKDSKQMDSLNSAIMTSDSMALKFVSTILSKHGWLGKSQIGSLANKTLFLTVQHSAIDTLKKYYPLLKVSVEKNESDKQDLATMEDRLLVYEGRTQKYGTQYKYDAPTDTYIIYPVEDKTKLNRIRKKVGLTPIDQQFQGKKVFIEESFSKDSTH